MVAEGRPVLPAPPGEWEHEHCDETTRRIVAGSREVEARVLSRGGLSPGDRVDGPALVEQSDTTTLIGPGDHAQVDAHHNLVITFDDPTSSSEHAAGGHAGAGEES